MPSLFLSPSVQQFNPYVNGLGSEEYYMNLIADAMEPYLYASGISFTRNDPDAPLSQAIALSNAADLTDRRMLEKIIMKSCKSAVKGGDVLSFQEIDSLMKDLSSCVNPFSCPHGRPTFIRMTRYEIEKMFKRV